MDEAVRFLRGLERFGGDVGPRDAAHLVFVRSDLAFGRICAIETSVAAALPGVLGVFRAADLGLPRYSQVEGQPVAVLQPPLALDTVRYVGQRIVAVVAETLAQAVDAAAAVVVDIEARPPVLGIAAAEDVVLNLELGSPWIPRADDVTVSCELHQPRVAPSPVETTSVCAVPGPGGRLAVITGTQLPSATHADLCNYLGLESEALRLQSVPMGGAFGTKTVGGAPDLSVTAACALKLGRAVRYSEDRSAHTAVNQARDQHQRWTLVADPDGRLRHVSLEATADAGAYVSTGAMEPATTALLVPGPYLVDGVHVLVRSVLTNTAPTGPYRGPGRAEAVAGLERAMDQLAAALGIDAVGLRRLNLLTRGDFPRTTPTGVVYDASDPHATLDRALDLAGWEEAGDLQRRRRESGETALIGRGVSTWVDATAGYFAEQQSSLCVTPDGDLSLTAGSAPSGQGHESVLSALVATRLCADADRVSVALPDSTGPIAAIGSFGSRSGQIVASAVDAACAALLTQACLLAADLLEAEPDDVVVHVDGRVGVVGVPDRALSVIQLGLRSHSGDLPQGVQPGLASFGWFAQDQRTFPSGCHAAVVEVDAETGQVTLLGLAAATDCGAVLDHDAVLGQAQGGMVQGAAQALFEEVVYDEAGNLLTANLLSYAVPAASEICGLRADFLPTPTDRNPLGVRGVGETGTVGAPAAVQNAVVDALSHLGVNHIAMPCTPERVWRALSR